MNPKTPVATRPGASSGKVTRKNAWVREQPSIIAASSSSYGHAGDEAAQGPDREGQHQRRRTRGVRPTTVLSRSIVSSILYWEMKSPSTGIIWITSSVTMKDIRPRNRNRETATAATNANTSATSDRSAA